MRADSKLTEAAKVEQTKVHKEATSSSGRAPAVALLAIGLMLLSFLMACILPKGALHVQLCTFFGGPARLPSDVCADALILARRSKKGPSKEDKTALAKAGAAVAAVAAVALGGYFVYKVRCLASLWGADTAGPLQKEAWPWLRGLRVLVVWRSDVTCGLIWQTWTAAKPHTVLAPVPPRATNSAECWVAWERAEGEARG